MVQENSRFLCGKMFILKLPPKKSKNKKPPMRSRFPKLKKPGPKDAPGRPSSPPGVYDAECDGSVVLCNVGFGLEAEAGGAGGVGRLPEQW